MLATFSLMSILTHQRHHAMMDYTGYKLYIIYLLNFGVIDS